MKNRQNTFQIAVWGLCAILAIALAVLVITDRKKLQERIILMQTETQNQNGEAENSTSDDAAYDSKKAASLYSTLISELQLNDFVFWGDNEMAGNENGSLARAFVEVSNGQLLDLISESFGEVIEKEKLAIPSMEVNNMGTSNEGMDEILVRAGVDGLTVGEWALIPGERDAINIVLKDEESGATLHFALQEEVDFGKVELSGVKGKLIQGIGEYDEKHPRFAFARDKAGESFQVGLGTEIEIESATKYIGDTPIFFFEDVSVDTVDSVDKFVGDLERLVQRYTIVEEENSDSSEELPYVIICTVDEESELDESLKEVFGDHFIRNETYVDDMTSDGYKELAQKVYANLDGQGCFDEMKTQIEQAVKELKTAE